ncbi:MAG: hypothetical protein AAF483_29795 [Planctomycetota bacterium]
MRVAEAIGQYEEAQKQLRKAKETLSKAASNLEDVIMNQLGEEFFFPCADDDPLSVVCDSYTVTLKPTDNRPAVLVDQTHFVE